MSFQSERPLQNRADPFGELHAVAARGTMMGNRGGRFHCPRTSSLHPRRRWASKQWIICVTEFRDRHRDVMGNSYTELFFLDEVTALAAGHRPCLECRRAAAQAFSELAGSGAGRMTAQEMDRLLHSQRLEGRRKRTWLSPRENLPDGAFFILGNRAAVRKGGRLLNWSFEGYREVSDDTPLPETVDVLTPELTVQVLKDGYRPGWHDSNA